jgi:isocitrate/isopropylmalate dehydrogenase
MSADPSDRFRQYRPRPLEILDTTLREAVRATLAVGIHTLDLGGAAKTGKFTRAVCRYLA